MTTIYESSPLITTRRESVPAADPAPRLWSALLTAQLLLEQGWIQNDYFLVRGKRGRTVSMGPLDLGFVRSEQVVGACLVGAVVFGGRLQDQHRNEATHLAALDLTWRALQETLDRPVPEPIVRKPADRALRVRDLTRWNDTPGRRQQEVLDLVEVAVRHTADVAWGPTARASR